ncbi:Protein NRT1/ PTR FAMILY 7.3 [Linum perenne]
MKQLELQKEGEVDQSSSNGYTRDGTLDWYGKPASKKITGGWRCALLILVNLGLLTLSIAGVSVNLVLFEKIVLRHTNAQAANSYSRWVGTCYLFSLFGALLSDSSLGRFLTCVVSEVFLIVGVVALSLSTHFLLLKPQGCGTLSSPCDTPKPFEVTIFYISIYLIALGSGASEPALAALGADQFDEEDPDEKQSKGSFYSYFYVAVVLGSLVAETLLAYLYSLGHWILGFWICTAVSIVAYLLLLWGTLRYRHFKPPSGNPVSRFSQVIVASFRKMSLKVPANGQGLYHQTLHERQSQGNAATDRRIFHTDDFRYRFLDRAAIVSSRDMERRTRGEAPNPWELCTVTQVEEVKCILRLLPIWVFTISSSLVFVQLMSLFVEQGTAMDNKVGSSNFHFPPASMPVFDMVTTSSFILMYGKVILPFFVKLTKRKTAPKPLTELQKVGLGQAIGAVSMVVAGIVEQVRLQHALPGSKETSSMSIFWITPQYVLMGISEALVTIAQLEFFATQAPDAMRSFSIGLPMVSYALGNFFSSILLTVVMKITSRNGKQQGWVPPNLNEGHLDRFFFLLAAILTFNLGMFIYVAKRFKPISMEKR